MAKKKTKTPKKLTNKIYCKCGKEWDKQTVLNDETIHTYDSYRFKFLSTYKIIVGGFLLVKLNACPNCREIS